MKELVLGVRRSTTFGLTLVITLMAGVLAGGWQVVAAQGEPIADGATLPASATIAFSTLGLVSLFLGMLYQRRYQRADDLIRELALLREPMHPDYREMQQLLSGWIGTGATGVDPRWVDKHERTLKSIGRFREYRQLFMGVPPFALVGTAVFTILLGVALLYWFLTMRFNADWTTFGGLLLFALTVELLAQLLLILWRITLFPTRGLDEGLHQRLGIPSWYTLLDVRYLAGRDLPFSSLVANHEAYLSLTREGGDWQISLQLPLPLRGWSWSCRVTHDGEALSEAEGEVALSPVEADRFFREAGLWLEVAVARWPSGLTAPDRFADLAVEVRLTAPGDPSALLLLVPVSPGDGAASWYGGGLHPGQPNRYPWYRVRYIPQQREEGSGAVRLVRPQGDRGYTENGGVSQ